MQPSDYLFCIDLSDPDYPNFCLTSKEYWDERGTLDDCLDEVEGLPDGFSNSMEAMWEYYAGSTEEGKQKLLDAGFVYSDEMDDFINGYAERLKEFQKSHNE